MKLRSVSRRWAARGAAPQPADPYAPSYHHAYRHGAVPTRAAERRMRAWEVRNAAAVHASAGQASASGLSYGGGIDGIGVTTGKEKVYLVFYGSQWGSQSTNSNGDVTLSGDPSGEAPRLQEFFKGLGTGGELWSGVMTQYCDGVATGAQSCPASNTEHVAYPAGGALAWVWVDESAASPGQATPAQLGTEAVTAAGHFGNTTAAANRDAQYVILSPHGTNPDSWLNPHTGFCAWHDDNTDPYVGVSSPYGDIAFTNFPYVTDAGSACGASFVNSGPAGTGDGITIVEGHEYAETITDQNPAGGWTDFIGSENGDKCAWIDPGTSGGAFSLTLATGTFPMQTTWANDGAGGAGSCEKSHPIVGNGSGNTVSVTNPGSQTASLGSPVNLAITASDSDAGQTLTYRASGLPKGLSIGSAGGVISGTPAAAGRFSTKVTVTDGTGAAGSASFTWNVTCGSRQLLGNPGFETGSLSPWTASPGVLQRGGTYPAYHGNWLARLDGRGGRHTDTLRQQVSLPRACSGATFAFYVQVRSNDPTRRAKAWDTLRVQVLNSSGKVLTTLAAYSNKNTRNSYFRHSFSLRKYLGKTITIRFTGKETLTRHDTAFLVDDTSLNVS